LTAATVLDERVRPETLGVIRAAVFLMWLVEVVPDPLSFWGELPDSMHEPIGMFKLVPDEAWDRLLEPEVLDRLQKVLVVLLVLSALGVRPYRPTAAATAALLTGQQALLRGFTFSNHEELGLLVCAYVLALFPAADGFAWPGRRRPTVSPETYATAVHAMSLLLLLPYCGIAARRLVRGAPDVFTGDSLAHWLGSLDALDPPAFGIGRWVLRHPGLVAFLKLGFVITTVFELLAPLCLIVPRLRRAWIPVIASMHLLNRLTMKLFFWQNSLLIVLLLTGTERTVARTRAWVSRGPRRARRARPAHGWSWAPYARS
jgi:hypothetical protein